MEVQIAKLEKWLSEYRADYFSKLNPPATDDEINKLEQITGSKIPTDLKKLYQWRNGKEIVDNLVSDDEVENELCLLTGTFFMPIASIIKFIKEDYYINMENGEGWKDKGWIPFMNNFSGIDILFNLKSGKVLVYDNAFGYENEEDLEESDIYPNIETWFDTVLKELYTNNFEEWEDYYGIVESRKDS